MEVKVSEESDCGESIILRVVCRQWRNALESKIKERERVAANAIRR